MWRPERPVNGPFQPTTDDIPSLNRVFSDAFTDRYRRDGLVGVRVPQLNPQVWEYAIRDADRGAMIWRDAEGEVVAFNIAHCSGAEGWMGPLAVRIDRQNEGVGRVIVEAAIAWLKDQGAATIGLETMPRTVDNIGFYSLMGFVPQYLTVTMTADVAERRVAGTFTELSTTKGLARRRLLAACRDRVNQAGVSSDFTREMTLTGDLGLGDTVAVTDGDDVRGFALYHSAPLADVRPADELRVLKLCADNVETFARLMIILESCAKLLRLRRVAVRCQTRYAAAYRVLLQQGYRVRWTDLRMTLDGYAETNPSDHTIIFSNWEI